MDNTIYTEISVPEVINTTLQDVDQFIVFYRENEALYEQLLINSGAIKFKGIEIKSTQDFQKLTGGISTGFQDYVDGNSPRTKLSANVYTSTEYDSSRIITMHNELSYTAKWPHKLFFSCLQPAQSGGETLLADGRKILRTMDKAVVSEIVSRGIIYVRNLHGGAGLGPSWQETFETTEKMKVEVYCRLTGTEFKWKEGGGLQLLQRSKGVINHRVTGEQVWFNQIDQFHPSHLGKELYEVMMSMFLSPMDFPMYVMFGDGGEIDEQIVKTITETIAQVTMAPKWKTNELLIVDNELMTHGRAAFAGDRKVLVTMSI
jgi:alpha-ketoglutarate-dependent taurine dioxygenase